MNAQTQPSTAWFELKGSSIDYRFEDIPVRFMLLQRGSERAGAWLVNGHPFLLVPAGEA